MSVTSGAASFTQFLSDILQTAMKHDSELFKSLKREDYDATPSASTVRREAFKLLGDNAMTYYALRTEGHNHCTSCKASQSKLDQTSRELTLARRGLTLAVETATKASAERGDGGEEMVGVEVEPQAAAPAPQGAAMAPEEARTNSKW